MNALLISPATPPTFWGAPLLVKASGKKAAQPPLGLITVAALLPPHWNLRLVDLNIEGLTEKDWQWADVVLTSGMWAHKESMFELFAEAGRRKITIAAGGPLASTQPEKLLAAGCDCVFVGEAETGLEEFVRALEQGGGRRIIRAGGWADMAASPVPRFDLLRLDDYILIPIQTSRGCPNDCEFCHVVQLFGRRMRYKTPAQTLAELDELRRLGWWGEIFIGDDNFIGHRGHARELATALDGWLDDNDRAFHFWTQASLDLGKDLEMIDLMTQAHVDHILVGVESADREVLEKAGKLQNVANDPVQMLGNLKRNGITVTASIIVGLDGERDGAHQRIAAMVEETGVPLVMINRLEAVPGTRLWARLEKEGRLVKDPEWEKYNGISHRVAPLRGAEAVEREYRALWKAVYDPARLAARAHRYHAEMRPTRAAQARAEGRAPAKETRASRRPPAHLFKDLRLLLWIVSRYSFKYGRQSRRTFWSRLFALRRDNPTRMVRFYNCLGLAVDYIEFARQAQSGKV